MGHSTHLTLVGARLSRRKFVLAAGASTLSMFGSSPAIASPKSVATPLPGAASDGFLVWNLVAAGYTSEEYLISGVADVYDSVSMADAIDMSKRNVMADGANRDFTRKVVQPAAAYVTRAIIYRPTDPAKFSGNVVTEVLHIGGGGQPATFNTAQPSFLGRGDVMIGVQHPSSFEGVRAADPSRYGAMMATHPTQVWGMMRDVGRRAKQGGFAGLRNYHVQRQYLTGRSFTGVATATFANFHHLDSNLDNGGSVFDGYVPITSGYFVRPLNVPVIRINTLSEFARFGLQNRVEDSDAKGSKVRLYEIAGACHYFPSAKPVAEAPRPARPAQAVAGAPQNDPNACLVGFGQGARMNDLPAHVFVAGAFDNIYAWTRGGAAPPHATRFAVDAKGAPQLDAHGNVLGGVRSPYVDAPLASYGPGEGSCANSGYARPLPTAELRALYKTKAAYLAKFASQTERLAVQRWIQPDAAHAMLAEAKQVADF
jgi:hypothetical protein